MPPKNLKALLKAPVSSPIEMAILIPPMKSGFQILYHGTNSYCWGMIQQKAELLPRVSLREVAYLIEDEYDLPRESVKASIEEEYLHYGDVGDNYVWMTNSRESAEKWASRGSVMLIETLRAAYWLIHSDRIHQDWDNGEIVPFLRNWIEKHKLTAVILKLEIPTSAIPPPVYPDDGFQFTKTVPLTFLAEAHYNKKAIDPFSIESI